MLVITENEEGAATLFEEDKGRAGECWILQCDPLCFASSTMLDVPIYRGPRYIEQGYLDSSSPECSAKRKVGTRSVCACELAVVRG